MRHPFGRVFALALLLLASQSWAGVSAPYQILTNKKNIIVWQEFAPWLMITEDLAAGRTCYFYNPVTKSLMDMKPPAAGTWAPLGSAIKWLMYADHYQGLDRLMAHDVDIDIFHIAWPSLQNQLPCGMSGTKCVFGQYRDTPVGDHYPVDLYDFNVYSGACAASCISDSEKTQFAHDGNLIVYRAYFGSGNARIYGHYFASTTELEIAARNGVSPSVCGSLVAWAEASGAGHNIVAKDISTGEMRTIAYTTANPPIPQAGRNSVFWETQGGSTGLDIQGYDWQTGQQSPVTAATGDQTKLRVCDDLVTWVTGPTGSQTLWGADIGPYTTFTGVVTGVKTGGLFYCQRQPGVGAVKAVLKTGQPAVSVGQRVTTAGKLSNDLDYFGTRIIDATVTQQGSGTVRPLAMPNASISSANAWMLVQTWGRVSGLTTTGGCRFYLTDGSHLPDNSGQGVLVTSPFTPPSGLANGAFASVEGIACVSRASGRQIDVVTDGRIRLWP